MAGSKTDVPCDCNWLEERVDDGRLPIVFDPVVNEYHFAYSTPRGPGRLIIRHCPWCGGRAPQSKRANLFARIPPEEEQRLKALIAPLQTLSDVLTALGPPDYDSPQGTGYMRPATETRGKEHGYFRLLRYEHLSPFALVNVQVLPGDAVSITFSGKYVGPSG